MLVRKLSKILNYFLLLFDTHKPFFNKMSNMLKNLHFHLTLYSQIPNKSFIVKWILARKMPFPAPFFVALTIMVRLFLHSLKQMMKQIHKKPSLMVQMLDRPKKTGTPTGNLSPPRAICMRRSSLWNTNINYKQENKSVKLQESLTQEKILHGCTTFFLQKHGHYLPDSVL